MNKPNAGSLGQQRRDLRKTSSSFSTTLGQQAPSNLWVISCYFNPAGYNSKRINLALFRERLEQQGVPYTIVECVFAGEAFELPLDPRILRIRAADVMWQKERLLNCAIETIPAMYKFIAWLDCDILFEDDQWASKSAAALTRHAVIQPYSWSVRLPSGQRTYRNEGHVSESFAWKAGHTPLYQRLSYAQHGRTGFAWAGRRHWLENYGLYDACIMGGADHLMAHIFDQQPCSPCLQKFWSRRKSMRQHFEQWTEAVAPSIAEGGLGAIEGRILHLWHGDGADRSYGTRQNILKQSDFNPQSDLRLCSSGTWEWASSKHSLHSAATTYFSTRNEDGTEQILEAPSIRPLPRVRTERTAPTMIISKDLDAAGRQTNAEATFTGSVIYEWHAWKGYMLPRILHGSYRMDAKPLEPLNSILARLPSSTNVFAFHLNFTDTAHFPLCRVALCETLLKRGIMALNSHALDISKRTIQSICRKLKLSTLSTNRRLGSRNDLVIVKTNRNYAGRGEEHLSLMESTAMHIDRSCLLESVMDYRILHREDVPRQWWSDRSLAIENYKDNVAGIKYRSYFAGDHHVIIKTFSDHMVMRLGGSRTAQTVCTNVVELQSRHLDGIPPALPTALLAIIRYMKLHFGAIDFLQDDSGDIYIVDVNTTTYARGLSDEFIAHLRSGLLNLTTTSYYS